MALRQKDKRGRSSERGVNHRNPFVFGDVVTGENFADRGKEIKELLSDLRGGQNILLFSPRRFGKTSLVKEVLARMDEREFLRIYVDLFPITSKTRFAEAYAAEVAKTAAGRLREMIGVIKEHIPGFRLVFGPEGVPGVEVEITKAQRDIDKILESLYDLPQRVAKKKGKRAVVVFDEFQEIVNLDGEDVQRGLRSKIQHHDRVAYVFMGSRRHLLDKIFSDKNRPLYRIGKPFHLQRIPPDEFGRFIAQRFESTMVKIDSEIVSRILQITESHPYYTQQLCHELWNLSASGGEVEDADVDLALREVLVSQNYAYTTIWDSLRGKQRPLLLAIAREGGEGVYSKDFVDRYDLGGASTVQKAIRHLVEKGLVERKDGDYVISDVFLKEWLKKA